ncbi:phage tail protein [Neisseria animalis]|uniref:Phage tail protein n=2 Tax=Neisseria animalis TaxID=492 RepID=A0A5P3MT75_NEIAN|nr:phage tail protein [Neisseria animalis]VEE07936.1 putative phage fiber-spike protein [Neisseria animalis]
MYLIFNSAGHLEQIRADQPVKLSPGFFLLEADIPKGYAWSDGKVIYDMDSPPPNLNYQVVDGQWAINTVGATAMLESFKSDKIVVLNAAAQDFINQQSGANMVPDFEFATWPLQATEAKAWAADKSAVTPILDGIAAARGMEPDKLKAAALRKALAYSALSAHVAGQRQALQSKIEAAKTQAALDKIVIAFTAPEAV